MSKIKFTTGQLFTVLENGNDEYFHVGKVLPQPDYTKNGVVIPCNIVMYEASGNGEIELSQTDFVVDSNVIMFNAAPGPRPRNIFRR